MLFYLFLYVNGHLEARGLVTTGQKLGCFSALLLLLLIGVAVM